MPALKSFIFWLIIFVLVLSLQIGLANSLRFYFAPQLVLIALTFFLWRFGLIWGLISSLVFGYLLDIMGASFTFTRVIILPLCILIGFILSRFLDIQYFWSRFINGLSFFFSYYILIIIANFLLKQHTPYWSLLLNFISTVVVFYVVFIVDSRLKKNAKIQNQKIR